MSKKGINLSRPKTLNYCTNRVFVKKKSAGSVGLFFELNNNNRKYDTDFLTFITVVENISPISFETKKPR